MQHLILYYILANAPPAPPQTTTENCVGAKQCREAAERKRQEESQLEKARRKLDECKGVQECQDAEKAYNDLLESQKGPEITEADLNKERAEYEQKQQYNHQKEKNIRHNQRSGLMVIGGGPSMQVIDLSNYLDAADPSNDPRLMYGGAYSFRLYKQWYLPRRRTVALGSGVSGLSSATYSYKIGDYYYNDQIHVLVDTHEISIPIEFRFGGGAGESSFLYGMIGGSIGVRLNSIWDTNANAGETMGEPVFRPALLGFGGYHSIGNTRWILGGEIRGDFSAAIDGYGKPMVETQLKVGMLF